MIDIFIFPDAVNRNDNLKYYKLNINQHQLTYFYNNKYVIIDTALLRDGSSSIVLYNPKSDDLYVLYNFREILQFTNTKPKDFLTEFQRQGLMQIDKSSHGVFVKVFLFKGDINLMSDTTDFSKYPHILLEDMTNLDRDYSWSIKNIEAAVFDDKIKISFTLIISEFWSEPIYLNHAGQSVLLKPGYNEVIFQYINSEDVYVGAKNSHYPGRKMLINKYAKHNK